MIISHIWDYQIRTIFVGLNSTEIIVNPLQGRGRLLLDDNHFYNIKSEARVFPHLNPR